MTTSPIRRALLRPLTAAVVVALIVGNGLSSAQVPLPVGGFDSENVTWVKNVSQPGSKSAAWGQLIGRHFYVQTWDSMFIYDVADPLEPELVADIPRPGPGAWPRDVAYNARFPMAGSTNGRIALILGYHEGDQTAEETALYVFDITDKTQPRQIAKLVSPIRLRGVDCILDCTWAYDQAGAIIDLRDPRNPRVMRSRWTDQIDASFNNNALCTPQRALPCAAREGNPTEVAPGRILTASVPMFLLDARKDPAHPRIAARSDGSPLSYQTAAWPNFARGGDVVLSSDTAELRFPRCEMLGAFRGTAHDSAFKVWDGSEWRRTGLITGGDEYRPQNGTYTDGNPAFSGIVPYLLGCGVSFFNAHPDFDRTGLVALAALSHGLKLLRVGGDGEIDEAGWFLGHGSITYNAYWVTDRVVYTFDTPRGFDIVRFDGELQRRR